MSQQNDISPGGTPIDDDGLGGVVDAEFVDLQQDQEQDLSDLASRNQSMALLPQRLLLSEGATKGDAIYTMAKHIPMNEYGLPTFFYRSDYLPFDLGTLTTLDADNCAVPLDYSDGYPTFNGGRIFWQQLPHEPMQDFLIFQRFLDQAEEVGIRQLQLLSMSEKISLDKISELSKEYLWQFRARAYDLFQVAADKKRRELLARKSENRHFSQADSLMATLMSKFEDPKWIDQLSPKEALDALGDLIKIQRISLGLAANGNAGPSSDNPNAGTTVELIMRSLTKNHSQGDESVGLTDELSELMKDPGFTMKAQELMFRINGNG